MTELDEPRTDGAVVDAPARRSMSGRRTRATLLPTASVVATLLALEALVRGGLLDSGVLPPPTEIIAAAATELGAGHTWELLGATMQGWAVGLTGAVLVGVLLGVLLASVPLLDRLLSGVIELVRPIPSIALIPLLVIMLGISMETKYVLVFLGSLWPILIHTVLGAREVDVVTQDTCRTYGVPLRGRFVHLTLPAAAPQFLTGLRIASSFALIITITVELIVGVSGLGQQVNVAQQAGNETQMWAYIGLAGLLGMVLNAAFQALERRTLHWHRSQQAGPA